MPNDATGPSSDNWAGNRAGNRVDNRIGDRADAPLHRPAAAPHARLSCRRDANLFGWLMYDWANSAYVTTVAVAVLPAYFAAAVVPAGGWNVGGHTLAATTLWGAAVSLSALIVFLAAPLLGAVADFSGSRKRFLAVCCLTGSLAATALWFAGPGLVLPVLGLFIVAQVGFVGGNVFYDALLPHVAAPYGPHGMDRVSGRGFAFGYVGGGLQFGLCLALIALHHRLGLTEGQAARLAMAFAGLWWGGFALCTLALVTEPAATGTLPPGLRRLPRPLAYCRVAITRVAATSREVRANRPLLLFLLAFLLYNDGIQTTIAMATIYGKEELGIATTTLMATLLMIQFVAMAGAEAFSALAARIAARRALMVSLVAWLGVTTYAWRMTTATEYVVLGAAVGLVLGGSQALSRSLYAAMIPPDRPAEYFGYFSVVNKFSSILGPLLFAGVRHAMGSARPALLFLSVFFVLGLVLLWRLGRAAPRYP
ncbi:MAG: MFS transporter [Desulfovibrionaceae bacterium]